MKEYSIGYWFQIVFRFYRIPDYSVNTAINIPVLGPNCAVKL